MGNTDVESYDKKQHCPIANCERTCASKETLTSHLYSDHRKNELAATIVVLMDLALTLSENLAHKK